MDDKIEKIIDLAGTRHLYQYLLLIVSFICWSNNSMLSVSLAFLEKVPDIQYKDPSTGEIVNSTLNYTVCDWEKNYTITKSYAYSWVIETDIVCKRTETGVMGVTTFLGDLISSLLFNVIADSFGRKNCMIFGSILFIIFNAMMIFVKGFYPIIILNFLINFSSSFTTYTSLVITEEITAIHLRGLFGAIINAGYPATALIYFPLFNYYENWRVVLMINSCVAVAIFFFFVFFVRESPRFYISKGRIKEALKVIKNIAKFHKRYQLYKTEIITKEYKDIVRELLHEQANNAALLKKEESKDTEEDHIHEYKMKQLKEKSNPWALIKYPSIRYRFLILCYLAFFIAGSHNGLSIYMKNLPGDIFTNGMIFYSFEVGASFLSGWLINTEFLGRKGTFLLLYFISSVSFFMFVFEGFSDIVKIIIYLVVKTAISGIFTIMYTYFLENYPTSIRALGFGINTAADSIGGSIFPLITEFLNEQVLFIVLGALNVSQLVLMIFMPETRNKPLPETIIEIEEERNFPGPELLVAID